MKTKNLIIAVLVLPSFGLVIKNNQINKAEWLLGTWEMRTSRGSVYETWKKESKDQLAGMSYMINENDTAVFERIRLIVEKRDIYYIPAVSNQNEGNEVRFKGTSISDNELIFENPAHDFPQKIKYTLIKKDSLVAEISAKINGEIKRQVFPMRKH